MFLQNRLLPDEQVLYCYHSYFIVFMVHATVPVMSVDSSLDACWFFVAAAEMTSLSPLRDLTEPSEFEGSRTLLKSHPLIPLHRLIPGCETGCVLAFLSGGPSVPLSSS